MHTCTQNGNYFLERMYYLGQSFITLFSMHVCASVPHVEVRGQLAGVIM